MDNNCDGLADELADTARGQVLVDDPVSQLGAQMGRSVAGLGDIDGDGAEDFAVGVPQEETSNGVRAGKVLIFSGADRSVYCTIRDEHGNPTARLGFSMSTVDDLDGDGLRDLAIGSFKRSTPAAQQAGAVLVFSTRNCQKIRALYDPIGFANSTLGFSLSTMGDLTGDGVGELIVGAPGFDYPEAEGGYALVISPTDGSIVHRIEDAPDSVGDRLGFAVAGVGDADGDGTPDFAVGAPNRMRTGLVGTIQVYSGSDGSLLHQVWDGDRNLGHALTRGADLSGDGSPDFVASSGEAGRASVFSASSGSRLWQLSESQPENGGADRISLVPDRDGDNVPEILLGRPSAAFGAGKALLFSGASGTLLDTLENEDSTNAESVGSSVGYADVNGDGRDDLLVGSTGRSQERGAAYICLDESDCDGDGAAPYGGADCDDGDASTYRDAEEVLDGKDNQCPPNAGAGAVDDLSGTIGFFDPYDPTVLSWPAQPGASLYEVARSPSPIFDGSCSSELTEGTSWIDPLTPSPGSAFHYLVRATEALVGSWGLRSDGTERLAQCP